MTLLKRITIVLILAFNFLFQSNSQIADPVIPSYNWTYLIETHFTYPLLDNPTLQELIDHKAINYHENVCLTRANDAAHSTNNIFLYDNTSNLPFLNGTTYHFNDYLHVGHVHYDIVLLEALKLMKIDRILHQRAACHGTLCAGIGSIDSFYKGYFLAAFNAFNQPNIPVYVRWTWKEHAVIPLYFSSLTNDYYNKTIPKDSQLLKSIDLSPIMCFQRLFRRVNTNYGAIPPVGKYAVQKFKEAAYQLIRPIPLPTYFKLIEPYKILFSYRGPQATRHISNLNDFINKLNEAFPKPNYILRLLNNSDPQLDFRTQLEAVGEAHVVLTNHGAFEGNMIYMKNSSLLLEIFGNYGNNEIHTFHRLALMFGIFYGRVQPHTLTDHSLFEFELKENDMNEIIDIIKHYFITKPYLSNSK